MNIYAPKNEHWRTDTLFVRLILCTFFIIYIEIFIKTIERLKIILMNDSQKFFVHNIVEWNALKGFLSYM